MSAHGGEVGPAGSLGLQVTRADRREFDQLVALSRYPARELSLGEIAEHGLPQRGLSEQVNTWRARNVLALAGALTPSSVLRRSVGKVAGGDLAPSGSVAKRGALGLLGALAPSGAATKLIARRLTGSITGSGSTITENLGEVFPTVDYPLSAGSAAAPVVDLAARNPAGAAADLADRNPAGAVADLAVRYRGGTPS